MGSVVRVIAATRTLRGLALACHPGPTVAVTAFSLAVLVGLSAPGRTVVVATVAVLTGQLSIGWSNDWVDAVRDTAAGRRDKPVVGGLVSVSAVRVAACLAATGCVSLSLATGVRPGVVHLVAVGGGWLYNVWLKRTWWSPLPYAVSFGLLPVFLVLALPGRAAVAGWVVLAAALLGVGAHLTNVLPDLEADVAAGIRGLPHRLGRRTTTLLAPAVLVAAVAVVVTGPTPAPGLPTRAAAAVGIAGAVAAGAVAVRRPDSRWPFALTILVAAVCVTLLVAAAPHLTSPA